MQEVLTKDGSYTCYNEEFKENYHSVSGAFEESFKKYVEPCGVKEGFKILDVCFGLGYNTCAAIFNSKNLKVIGLEFDRNVLDKIKDMQIPKEYEEKYSVIRKVASDLKFKDSECEINILLGDARKTIKEIDEKFDAIFLDPFSTTKNTELWTVEFFKELKRCLNDDGILATYSSSSHVRAGLIQAGFKIGNGPVVGRVRPSTLASIDRELPVMTEFDLKLIRVFGKPFRDNENMTLTREEIMEGRVV